VISQNGFTNPFSLDSTPDGWEIRSIESLCRSVTSGGTPSRSNPEFYEKGSIRWYKTKELNDWYLEDSEEKITQEAIDNSSAKVFPTNTVLMAMYGDGDTITTLGILREEAATNQACCAMIVNSDVCHHEYLLYALKYHRNAFIQIATGGAQRNLSGRLIRNFAIQVPPLPVQRRIAEILGRLDDKIEVNRRINRTLEAMAQALYQHWFVDFGPFQDGEFVESALGLIPGGWTTTTLKEITTKIGSGATPRGGSNVYVAEGINLIRSQNVYDSAFAWEGLARISDDEADKLRNVTVEEGDVLINITGDSILRTCVADQAMLPARVNQHVAIIRPAPDIPGHFIHQHLLRPETKDNLLGMSSGATRKAITKGHLESTQMLLPPTPVLNDFRAKTDPFFAQISINGRESHKLTEIRDYLLPKLLAGEIAVEVAAAQAAEVMN
jgi:type I restriction enzyme S subunit